MGKEFIFKETCKQFINNKNVAGYNVCMNSFEEYLGTINMTESSTIQIYFQGITSDALIKSLEYYIVTNGITSYSAANKYISAIKEYFLFLVQSEFLRNDELMAEFAFKTTNPKSYRCKANKFLESHSQILLNEVIDAFEDAKDLIAYCDDTMNNIYNLSLMITNQTDFNKFRSALIIKLTLLTGAVYRQLIKLKESDIDIQHCRLTLNGLTIHIPYNLIDQLTAYKKMRSDILMHNNKNTKEWFIEFSGDTISTTISTTSDYLIDISGRGDINGIVKFTIINMIREGINQSIIMKFTGAGSTIYDYCQEKVNDTMDLESSSYLDSRIRRIETFDLL